MRIFDALLSTSVLLIFSLPQALAEPEAESLNIEEVAVTIGDLNTTLEITGSDFGSPLEVTLAGVPAVVTSVTSTTIVATVLTAAFPAGDYRLTVSRGSGSIKNDEYDLTIGAVGVVSFAVGNTRGGTNALVNNTTGNFNSAYGVDTLTANTTGSSNTAVGAQALQANITGLDNTAVGNVALQANTTGRFNTAVGDQALWKNTTGANNTASGHLALGSNTTGQQNAATGVQALQQNTTGNVNTATGVLALGRNTTGCCNTATGARALGFNTTGSSNTAIGREALGRNTTGIQNIALGAVAGGALTTGSNNIMIGNNGVAGESATIRIGRFQNRAFIEGIRGKTTGFTDAVAVLIDSAGQLGTISSSRRYKEDIEDMAGASDGLLSLRPVTFRYKQAFENGNKPIQYGLVAEEVAEVFPDLVVYDEDGEPETVKYHMLATLLLNELQKQQQVTADQAAQLAAVEMQLAELTALTSRLAQSVTPVSEVQLASN